MSFASEFREFAVKGNVVDLAVGVIFVVTIRRPPESPLLRLATLFGAGQFVRLRTADSGEAAF